MKKKNKKGMLARMIAVIVILLIVVFGLPFLVNYANDNPKKLCEEKNLEYFEKSCGFGCVDRYCIDDELNFKYEILYVGDEYILKEIKNENKRKSL